MKRILLTGGLMATIITCLATAAHSTLLDALLGDFLHQSYRELADIIHQEIGEDYDPSVAAILRTATGQALGVIGFPDPYRTEQSLEDQLSALPQQDITAPVPITQLEGLTRELNRDLLRQQSNTLLSETGQLETEERQSLVAETVLLAQQDATTAQTAISTQQAIKLMTQLQARQAELLGTMQSELMQGRQDTAVQSLAIADISETLDRQLSAEQTERRAEALIALRQAAIARLF